MVVLVLLAVALVGSEGRAGARLEVRLEVALAAEGLLTSLALEGVHVHVEVICKEMGEQRYPVLHSRWPLPTTTMVTQ